MRARDLPQGTLARLLELDDLAQRHTRAAEAADAALRNARHVLSGNYRPTGTKADGELYEKVQSGFAGILQAAQTTRRRADDTQKVLSACKIFVEQLAADAVLEVAEAPQPNGLDLAQVRTLLAAARAEINKLKILPVPSDDIKQRVTDYVDTLARKRIFVSGIRAGEQLEFMWPGSIDATIQAGYVTMNCNPLIMAAQLQPDLLTEHLLQVIERDVAEPCPPAQRPGRIAELEAQLTQLQALQVYFIDQQTDIAHDPATSPAVVLGVTIVDANATQRMAS